MKPTDRIRGVALASVFAVSSGWHVTLSTAYAQSHDHSEHHGHMHSGHSTSSESASSEPASDDGWTKAEVRKLDLEQGKLTLRHERIESLDMAPMTMVFRLGEGVSADGLNEGDSVRFKVQREMGRLVITALEAGVND